MPAPVRPLAASSVMVALALMVAGCSQAPAPLEDEGPADEDEFVAWGLAPAGEEGPSPPRPDWFLMMGRSGPEGELSGYRWSVPPQAVRPHPFFGADWFQVSLEFVPVVPAASAAPDEWALLVFSRGSDGVQARHLALFTPLQGEAMGPLDLAPHAIEAAAPLEAWWAALTFSGDARPEELHFVLAAAGPSPGPFGIAMRAFEGAVPTGYRGPAGFDAFLEDRSSPRPGAVSPVGTGTGFQVAGFSFFTSPLAGFRELYNPAVRVEDAAGIPRVREHGVMARDVTLSHRFDAPSGWSYGAASFFGWESAGWWSADVQARSESLHAGAPFARSFAAPYVSLASLLLFGSVAYFITGEGEGSSESAFRVQGASAGLSASIQYLHVDLGATLGDLVGVGAQTGVFPGVGLLGPVGDPPLAGHAEAPTIHLGLPTPLAEAWSEAPAGGADATHQTLNAPGAIGAPHGLR